MIEKTLDDVIKALAFCQKGLCDEECPYWYEEKNRLLCQEVKCIHAQYYLEEYKKICNTLLINVTNLLNNKPLTWEELKQMRDKPVWIQEGDHGYWIIIESFSITSFGIHWLNSAEGCLEKEDMGINWNAYRYEI